MNSGEIKPNRVAARSRLALLYIFLAVFPFLVGTSHSRAQVKADEQTLAFRSEIVASGGLAGAAQAAASLPLRANVITQQAGIAFAPSSWILIGLMMMLCAYLGSRRMKRDAQGALRSLRIVSTARSTSPQSGSVPTSVFEKPSGPSGPDGDDQLSHRAL